MADLSDVTTLLGQMAEAAVYPSGTGAKDVAGFKTRLIEGWPLPDQLDLDLQGKMLASDGKTIVANPHGVQPVVSIFPMMGATATPYQLLPAQSYVIVPAAHGLTAAISNGTVALSGTPGAGEYVTIVADGNRIYSRVGASAAAILAAIRADAAADYPGVLVSGNSITFPTTRLTVRIGAPATMGEVSHRQKHGVMITVWAPDPISRSALAAAIDNAFKQTVRITLPDTSQALLTYDRTNVIDREQNLNIYRRDLIFQVEYATVTEYQAFEITSFSSEPYPAQDASFTTPSLST
jgi:hypothetical protein